MWVFALRIFYHSMDQWSMDRQELWLVDEAQTEALGRALARTIYHPAPLLLLGDVGAGKTTLLRGLAEGLGIDPRLVVSPTFGLVQSYPTERFLVQHLDLYRLSPAEVPDLLRHLDPAAMPWLEWADRLPSTWTEQHSPITLTLREQVGRVGRSLEVTYGDVRLPSQDEIDAWRREVRTPMNVVEHCEQVGAVAAACAQALRDRGQPVRVELARRAGQLHDLLRFLDFLPAAAPANAPTVSRDDDLVWADWRQRYPHMAHEVGGERFLRERGYPEVGQVVATHGLAAGQAHCPRFETIEQALVFYADKRVRGASVVSVRERFDDFVVRYSSGRVTPQHEAWLAAVLEIERDLFAGEVPALASV